MIPAMIFFCKVIKYSSILDKYDVFSVLRDNRYSFQNINNFNFYSCYILLCFYKIIKLRIKWFSFIINSDILFDVSANKNIPH